MRWCNVRAGNSAGCIAGARPSLVTQMKRICLQCERPGFNPCIGKTPWRREWPPTPVSILAWWIPWTEWPGGLQPMGLWRAGHDWATKSCPLYSWGSANVCIPSSIYWIRSLEYQMTCKVCKLGVLWGFLPHHVACGISVPQPGMEPNSWSAKSLALDHGGSP